MKEAADEKREVGKPQSNTNTTVRYKKMRCLSIMISICYEFNDQAATTSEGSQSLLSD